ncbi:hypothetical protein O181_063237 [Austropuccinia psidii MF-1]|uniref:BHLH domain-containing protein n=1 Tax=Austropuccinia psidii MF-1 TaxID=1389203 RepID=A0A9Q3EP77_9BASI|nr:hypothetical protein [Austropuccinia psidii MF-1]
MSNFSNFKKFNESFIHSNPSVGHNLFHNAFNSTSHHDSTMPFTDNELIESLIRPLNSTHQNFNQSDLSVDLFSHIDSSNLASNHHPFTNFSSSLKSDHDHLNLLASPTTHQIDRNAHLNHSSTQSNTSIISKSCSNSPQPITNSFNHQSTINVNLLNSSSNQPSNSILQLQQANHHHHHHHHHPNHLNHHHSASHSISTSAIHSHNPLMMVIDENRPAVAASAPTYLPNSIHDHKPLRNSDLQSNHDRWLEDVSIHSSRLTSSNHNSSRDISKKDSPPSSNVDQQQSQGDLNEKRRKRRESHNAVERRRRDNINERISELASLLPSCMLEPKLLSPGSQESGSMMKMLQEEDEATTELNQSNITPSSSLPTDSLLPPGNCANHNKPNKGIILAKSIDYIRYLKDLLELQLQRNSELESELEKIRKNQKERFKDEDHREVLNLNLKIENQNKGMTVEQETVENENKRLETIMMAINDFDHQNDNFKPTQLNHEIFNEIYQYF